MIIGITGSSGSGKTTISNILKEKLNCNLVNADYIAREMSRKNNKYYEDIVAYFGNEILDENGEIHRKSLAKIIYEDDVKREKLNAITNIHVAEAIKQEAFALLKDNNVVIIDVPRLIESGLNIICDIIVSVLANEDIKLERICNRDGIDIEMARKRVKIQPKDSFYINNSNYIITTNDEETETQIENIVNDINKEIKNNGII